MNDLEKELRQIKISMDIFERHPEGDVMEYTMSSGYKIQLATDNYGYIKTMNVNDEKGNPVVSLMAYKNGNVAITYKDDELCESEISESEMSGFWQKFLPSVDSDAEYFISPSREVK